MNAFIAGFAILGMAFFAYFLALKIAVIFANKYFAKKPINCANRREYQINIPNNVSERSNTQINKDIISQIPPIHPLNKSNNAKPNEYPFNFIFEFFTNQFDKVFDTIHSGTLAQGETPNQPKRNVTSPTIIHCWNSKPVSLYTIKIMSIHILSRANYPAGRDKLSLTSPSPF